MQGTVLIRQKQQQRKGTNQGIGRALFIIYIDLQEEIQVTFRPHYDENVGDPSG